jgi:hypothetical protein
MRRAALGRRAFFHARRKEAMNIAVNVVLLALAVFVASVMV